MASLKRKFDGESGQVYHEIISKTAPNLSWLHGPKNHVHLRAARAETPTLLQIAKRTLLENLQLLPAESLQNVPWHLVADVWQGARERKLDHLHCWRTFALAFQERPCFRWRPADISSPSGPIGDYLSHLNSPSARWLVSLTISLKFVTKAELVRLPTMIENLAALELVPPKEDEGTYSYPVDDRLIRAWAAMVKEAQAGEPFGRLRVLVMRQPNELTPAFMNELITFPKLDILTVQLVKEDVGSFESVASTQGWLVKAPDSLQYTKVTDDGQWGRFSHAHAMMHLHNGFLETPGQDGQISQPKTTPSIDFSFGLPWKNRGSVDRQHCVMPDSPYSKPNLRGLETMCFVKVVEKRGRATIANKMPIRKPERPPQKRMRPASQGRDLESMLSSFTQPPSRPSANRSKKQY